MSLIENNDRDNFYPVAIPEADWHCDYLWSTHRGCPFDCVYCSSKRWNKRFGGDPAVPRRLKGEWKYGEWRDCHREFDIIKRKVLPYGGIFVTPYCDIMTLPDGDIRQILKLSMDSLNDYGKSNRYVDTDRDCFRIFQTKDPAKYFDYLDLIPSGSWLGTTIETININLEYKQYSKAMFPSLRALYMQELRERYGNQYKWFVTIEPIMKFDKSFYLYMQDIKPDLIFIGCDTGKNNLPEPSRDELIELIEQLKQITHVHVKKNAERILKDDWFHGWENVIKYM